MILVGGSLGDRFGRKRIYAIGVFSGGGGANAQQFLDAQRINLAAAKVPPGLSNEVSTALREAIALTTCLVLLGLILSDLDHLLTEENGNRQFLLPNIYFFSLLLFDRFA